MHALGSPSYRVEDAMAACALALGLRGNFFCTPTAIFAAIGPVDAADDDLRTTLRRVVPGEHDLGRLARLYVIRDTVVRGDCPPADGLERLRAVLAPRARRAPFGELAAYLAAGGGAAVLFGGDLREVAVAALAGLLVGVLAWVAGRRPALGDVQAALAGAVVAFVAHLLPAWHVAVRPPLVTIAAIVVLLPGLSFTTALAELAMRHLAAGSARLMGAMAVLVTMAIGVGLGDRAAGLAVGPAIAVTPHALAWPWQAPALLAIAVAFAVLLRAARNQWFWVLVGVALGYGGARLGSAALGAELGGFVGACAVGVGANLFARARRQPSAIVRTPGLLLLVPGSLGFRGLTTAIDADFAASAQFAFQTLLAGGAIVAGLLFAGVALPPPLDVEPDSRRPLRTGVRDR